VVDPARLDRGRRAAAFRRCATIARFARTVASALGPAIARGTACVLTLGLACGACERSGEPAGETRTRPAGIADPSPALVVEGPARFPVTHDCRAMRVQDCPDPTFETFTLLYRPTGAVVPRGGARIQMGFDLPNGTVVQWRFGSRFALEAPQTGDPSGEGHLRVVADVPHVVSVLEDAIEVRFPRGAPAGAPVRFVFGDRSGGGPGHAMPNFAVALSFYVREDLDGDGRFDRARLPPAVLETVGTRTDGYVVVAPSRPRTSAIRVHVRAIEGATDAFQTNGLLVPGHTGLLGATSSDPAAVLPASVSFAADGGGMASFDAVLPTPGIQTVTVFDLDEPERRATSPPIEIGATARSIHWGVLHHHTQIGGHAIGSAEQAYVWARDVSRLDFLAITDHCRSPVYDWPYLRGLPDRFDRPGEFVTFLGYEWTHDQTGHRHVLFRDPDDAPVFCEVANRLGPRLAGEDFRVVDRVADLLRSLAEREAIALVHHPQWKLGESLDWGDPADPVTREVQRLVEVYSTHGCSEETGTDLPIHGDAINHHAASAGATVRDAIAMGFVMGFTAGDDIHFAKPGAPLGYDAGPANRRYSQGGLTAVLADECTRESLWEALRARRVYGTTGARILLAFTIGGAEMGSETTIAEAPRLTVRVAGTASLESIEVYRDGRDRVHVVSPGTTPGVTWDEASVVSFDWEDASFPPGVRHSYYVRVRQVDGHLAWSSPIWCTRVAEDVPARSGGDAR